MTSMSLPPGTAPVKRQFLLSPAALPAVDDDAAEGSTAHTGKSCVDVVDTDTRGTGGRKKWSKAQKKERRGANKGRKFGKVHDQLELCLRVANGKICEHGDECRFTHDIDAYLAAKPRDIRFPSITTISDVPPFIMDTEEDNSTTGDNLYSLEQHTSCPSFAESGFCRLGLKCRFLGAHAKRDASGVITLVEDEEKRAQTALSATELNFVSADTLKLLRSKKYPKPITDVYLKELEAAKGDSNGPEENMAVGEDNLTMDDPPPVSSELHAKRTGNSDSSAQTDTPDVPIRVQEKRRLDWSGKSYLAPLTTVGNLPFRRLCVTLGADITCGEMGLATSFLTASASEFSLVRRHPSESMFGIQLAGNKPSTLVATAEVLGREFGDAGGIDFVDVNCGCPIDLVFKSGSGSALLDAPAKLGKIVTGMSRALGEIPVTIKLRTGVKDGRNNAHKIMPRAATEWGIGCITLHGRTRQQRYTKLADWEYIKQCVDAVRAQEADEGLSPIPIFGGGDCFSSHDYWTNVSSTGVDGVMIGRGALIKPWIFTEVKEHREWDISSRERLQLIGKFTEFGLSHFGTDTTGVNTTRRFLCEALSFQYRYVPIGLLERLPAKINDRAPTFKGRDELETLLASPNSQDWVKISEMFLGPAPESWSFTPKHKSNSHGEESQG
ncbi:zinc finger dihydrouridine synthase [Suillus subaureus]|uniref:tRNA-dihydrouridine(47) synthase [NAD(P)(+)] n=1 Tax=Suillus subaureus TaxID=48587 RepID=A0A9P7E0H0_9AGAM|nr:zinc finger dihydrouridine synthase [Suillus subaureus]KAG1807502.1 zinc finger dihydrouridine synthase [Suillus subaureus]